MSGKTIEVMSTDAEGRLVLSDAVTYVQEEHDPSLLINIATLTGSAARALGDERTITKQLSLISPILKARAAAPARVSAALLSAHSSTKTVHGCILILQA